MPYLCVAAEGKVSHQAHGHAHQGPRQDSTARDVPVTEKCRVNYIGTYAIASLVSLTSKYPSFEQISLWKCKPIVYMTASKIKQGERVRDSQVRVAWKLAEAHDKEKTIDPIDLRVPVMLKVVYTLEVWLIVCLIGPPISTNISTATISKYMFIVRVKKIRAKKFLCRENPIFRTDGADREETDIRQVSKMAEHAYGHHEQSHCNNRCEKVVARY